MSWYPYGFVELMNEVERQGVPDPDWGTRLGPAIWEQGYLSLPGKDSWIFCLDEDASRFLAYLLIAKAGRWVAKEQCLVLRDVWGGAHDLLWTPEGWRPVGPADLRRGES